MTHLSRGTHFHWSKAYYLHFMAHEGFVLDVIPTYQVPGTTVFYPTRGADSPQSTEACDGIDEAKGSGLG